MPERVGDARLPGDARVLFTGCGTSYHAALACGTAVQALELVLGNAPSADILVAVSHEGETRLTREAVEAFAGETWLLTGAPESPIARAADRVLVVTPELEESYCHTASYTSAVAAGRAIQGEDVTGLADAVAAALETDPVPVSGHERFLVTGAGEDYPTALEAVLKLREGVHLAAEAHHTEQLLHGHLAAVDSSVRCFLLEGSGSAAERARAAERALQELGCETTLFGDGPSRGRHRPLPAADRGPRDRARRRPGQDPLGRGALGPGPQGVRLGNGRRDHVVISVPPFRAVFEAVQSRALKLPQRPRLPERLLEVLAGAWARPLKSPCPLRVGLSLGGPVGSPVCVFQ